MDISGKIRELADTAMRDTEEMFRQIDQIAQFNTEKVLTAFQRNRVDEGCFAASTGYGYGDKGRETLDRLYADVFSARSALVRIGFVNGTHAITSALFAALPPGKTLISATGRPYDTLCGAIGIAGDYRGSLRDYGVCYGQVELLPGGVPDLQKIAEAAADRSVGAVLVQRSRGYSDRPALTVRKIGEICRAVHGANPAAAVVVDNCYGEFTERTEPTEVGADLIAGSLIKNPGGGLAPTGGYVLGRRELVAAAAYRLTSPGIGGECGASLGVNRQLYQGLFMAPHVVAQAQKTAVFCASLMELLGFCTSPPSTEMRSDIVQAIEFGDPETLVRFCKGIQSASPVDSFVSPEPWDMPGYDCKVVMAAGTFMQGASIELSADGPLRPPYRAYIQGGLTFEAGKLGILRAAETLIKS